MQSEMNAPGTFWWSYDGGGHTTVLLDWSVFAIHEPGVATSSRFISTPKFLLHTGLLEGPKFFSLDVPYHPL